MCKTRFNMQCSKSTLEQLGKLAVEYDLSLSGMCRLLIKEAYEKEFLIE